MSTWMALRVRGSCVAWDGGGNKKYT